MRLYHGTSIEAAQSIAESGLIASSNDESRCNRDVDGACIYGFDNLEDAQDFALNQGLDNQAVIAFDADDAVADPEYGESAYYCSSSSNERIAWTHDMGDEVFYG